MTTSTFLLLSVGITIVEAQRKVLRFESTFSKEKELKDDPSISREV